MIYLDHNATTPLDPDVFDAMLPFFKEEFGNAASRNHDLGKSARAATELARAEVAQLIGASPGEITWTSGATEADNLAILGVAEALEDRGRHLITAATEHKAVLDPCRYLERRGWELTVLPVDGYGQVDPQVLEDAIRDDTALVSIMAANNEIGTLQPVDVLGTICKQRGVLFHCDAAQAAGKIPLDVQALGVDLLSLSAHKMHGPKGVGALWVRSKRPRVKLVARMHGGGHEMGLRSGTLNVPGVVGMGEAARKARLGFPEAPLRMAELRDRLWTGLQEKVSGVHRNGHPSEVLPNTLNVRIEGITADMIFWALGSRLAISSGSACSTSSLEPSYVITALGLGPDEAYASLRFSVGRFSSEADVDGALAMLAPTIAGIRQRVPARDPAVAALFE